MKSQRILIFGDSIGQGYYDEVNGGWAQRLQRDFFAEQINGTSDFNVVNLSMSGHTSNEVLQRIDFETASRKKAGHDILTIIAVGVNDSYEKNGVRRTVETNFKNNINKIIGIAQSHGDVVVLGCSSCVESRVSPTSWDETLVYKNDLLQKYEGILKDAASENGIDFVPLWSATNEAQQSEETLPDGIHPNTAGHEVIYNEVKKKLTAWINNKS